MKMRAETRRDSTGRLDHLTVRKGRRRKGVDLQFIYGTDGFLRDIEFTGRREDMPSIPEIVALINEKFMERIGTIQNIERIGNIAMSIPTANIEGRFYQGIMLDSGTRTATGDNSATPSDVKWAKEGMFFLDVTAVSGTDPTLDVTIQTKDDTSGCWFPIATFTQKTAVGRELKSVSANLGSIIAVFWKIEGTDPSFMFSVGFILKSM